MNVEVKKAGPCRCELEIVADSESVGKVYKEILGTYVKNASLPGFRKGRAPLAMVEARFAKDLKKEAQDRIISKSYNEALEQESLEVCGLIDLEEGDFDPKTDYRFKLIVDVDPDFKLPNCEGIKIKSEQAEPTEKDIDEAVEGLLERYATYEEVVEARTIARDDMVKIDYSATVDGAPLAEVAPGSEGIAEKQDYWMLVNHYAFLPDMEEGLIGCSVGDEKDVKVSFAADFSDEALAGKTAVYHVKVKAHREKTIPALDDKMLAQLGVESEDDLRGKIKESMQASSEERERDRQRDEICKYLIKKTKMEVPQSLVDREARSSIQSIVRQRMARGASQEDIEKAREEIFKEASAIADQRVRLEYILDRIADDLDLSVSEDELQASLRKDAMRYGMDPERFIEMSLQRSSPEALSEALRLQKAIDALLEKAIVK
jgi:trigger factor